MLSTSHQGVTVQQTILPVPARRRMCVSAWVGIPALAGILVANAALAQSSGNWYYCDLAHAYYPYVRTCPMPWRAVAPNANPNGQFGQPGTNAAPTVPTQAAPIPPTPSPTDSRQSSAFLQGQVDRQGWEAWFGSQTGDYRTGANYWASQRSLPHPGSCSAVPPSTGADWTAGCVAAQQKLASSDVRRKTEPDYRLGWNNPPPIASSPSPANSSEALGSASPPAQAPISALPSTQKPADRYAEEHKDDIDGLGIGEEALDSTIRLGFSGAYVPFLTLRQFLGFLFENRSVAKVSYDDMTFGGVDYIVIQIKRKGSPQFGIALKHEMDDLFVNYIVKDNRGYPIDAPADAMAVAMTLKELCNPSGN
jgi:hypothetical protein